MDVITRFSYIYVVLGHCTFIVLLLNIRRRMHRILCLPPSILIAVLYCRIAGKRLLLQLMLNKLPQQLLLLLLLLGLLLLLLLMLLQLLQNMLL